MNSVLSSTKYTELTSIYEQSYLEYWFKTLYYPKGCLAIKDEEIKDVVQKQQTINNKEN